MFSIRMCESKPKLFDLHVFFDDLVDLLQIYMWIICVGFRVYIIDPFSKTSSRMNREISF